MDSVSPSAARMKNRGSSALIKLDIPYGLRQSVFQNNSEDLATRNSSRSGREGTDEFEFGASGGQMSDFGKAWMIAEEENCLERPLDAISRQIYSESYPKKTNLVRRRIIYPLGYRYVTINFRIMRRNAVLYVGYLLNQKGLRRSDLYKARYLPLWTHCLRVRIRFNVKVGFVFNGLKSRLGLTSVKGLHFCIDGFYGLEDYGDAFGNVGNGVCPWMELSGDGSPKSLCLNDGDNVYLSVATERMCHLGEQRKSRISSRILTDA